MNYLCIEYANPLDLSDSITVEYRLRNNSLTRHWVNKVLEAQKHYSIDDPNRFYWFGSEQQVTEDALDRINNNIKIIKLELPDLGPYVDSVHNQDLLNYWHNIFERYHKLLNQQEFATVSSSTLVALADLNLCVHRCEDVARGKKPRQVTTYYRLPKTSKFDVKQFEEFENVWQPGTVFVNYVEIGKTLLDLAMDRDQYIGADAFQPYLHYSADFNIRFHEKTQQEADYELEICQEYYKLHKEKLGNWTPSFAPGMYPLADLTKDLDLSIIQAHQYVKSVTFK